MQHVSIRDLAAACGVSISTVSKALHGNGRISEETARRITETAAAMGYTGSQAARALAARPRRIGLVLRSPVRQHDPQAQVQAWLCLLCL